MAIVALMSSVSSEHSHAVGKRKNRPRKNYATYAVGILLGAVVLVLVFIAATALVVTVSIILR